MSYIFETLKDKKLYLSIFITVDQSNSTSPLRNYIASHQQQSNSHNYHSHNQHHLSQTPAHNHHSSSRVRQHSTSAHSKDSHSGGGSSSVGSRSPTAKSAHHHLYTDPKLISIPRFPVRLSCSLECGCFSPWNFSLSCRLHQKAYCFIPRGVNLFIMLVWRKKNVLGQLFGL